MKWKNKCFFIKLAYPVTWIAVVLLYASCSPTRHLPPGELLYTGAKVSIEEKDHTVTNKKQLQSELNAITTPRPNKSILGWRYKLAFYNMIDTVTKPRGLKHYIKYKLGEPPVLFSQVGINANKEILKNRMENRGYFTASAKVDSITRRKKIKLQYIATPGPRYLIRSVDFLVDSTVLGKAIAATRPNSLMKPGDPFDLDVIKAERNRVDYQLKEKGFYYFKPDDLIIKVDSTVEKYRVDLYLTTKDNISEKSGRVYKINNITIFSNYSLTNDSLYELPGELYKEFYIVDPGHTFKPSVFERAMFFHKGDLYNRTDHNRSISRLVNLGVFRFVKNQFIEADDDPALMNVRYYLTPMARRSLNLEVRAKRNDADFTGSDISINWRNRNTFHGAEHLVVSLYGGFELQAKTADGLNNRNYYKAGAEINLSIPRFIAPFKWTNASAYLPRTKFTTGYDYLYRTNSYVLNSIRLSGGYIWKESIRKEHELKVIDVNYVQPINVTQLYKTLAAADPTLNKAIEKQFIIGSNYRYNYTTTMLSGRMFTMYFQGMADLSGNLPGLISGADIRNGKEKTLFGGAYSQYIKLEADYRAYVSLTDGLKLASRVIGGYGYAYGNSVNLPFIKQFIIGGSNSIRAFPARSIGPGAYYAPHDPRTTSSFTADQGGDIKLELNTELRARLASIVEGAVYVDAGNIWLLNQSVNPQEVKPGALFGKDFADQLAVGTGIGLRFDLSFLVLRLDVATPLRKPWYPEGERWTLREWKPSDTIWRRENLNVLIAIGYPF